MNKDLIVTNGFVRLVGGRCWSNVRALTSFSRRRRTLRPSFGLNKKGEIHSVRNFLGGLIAGLICMVVAYFLGASLMEGVILCIIIYLGLYNHFDLMDKLADIENKLEGIKWKTKR